MQELDEGSDRGGAIRCPECHYRSRCVDSRPCEQGIRRRRMCRKCGKRFTTLEVVVGIENRAILPQIYLDHIIDDLKTKHGDLAKIIADLEAMARLHGLIGK